MIYITYKSDLDNSYIKNVWESQYVDLQSSYKAFLKKHSIKMGIIINEHWTNIMSQDVNNHLTKEEYKRKSKEWKRFIKEWTFDKFIEVEGKGKKMKYISSYL